MVPLLLVRHGRAGNRSKWKRDDRLRPLSRRGLRQAKDLVPLLEPYKPKRILASPYVRCAQTVEPLASKLGSKVEEVEELAEGKGPEAVSLLASLLDLSYAVVVCTHGDVMLEALSTLGKDVPQGPPAAKGAVWVLERKKRGGAVVARYLPPPT